MKMKCLPVLMLASVLGLSACAAKQAAAPVENGLGAQSAPSTAPAVVDANPYGANTQPVDNAAATAPSAYTPPVAATSGGFVPNYSPVDINAPTHTVQPGDTVYNVSKRYHITQENLRAWNNLNDNTLKIGQVLKVKPKGAAANYTPIAATPPVRTTATTAVTTTTTTTTVSGSTRTAGGITWMRPTPGAVLTRFGGDSKGIDIAGSAGQPVVASADGKVVYAGAGLRGYGNLVIVQHNRTFLSAYGHNQGLLVKEGQQVRRGQQIATLGSTDANRPELHFEVREQGKPVDPLLYIP